MTEPKRVYTVDSSAKAVEIYKALGSFVGEGRVTWETHTVGNTNYYEIMVDTSGNFVVDYEWMEGFCYAIHYMLNEKEKE